MSNNSKSVQSRQSKHQHSQRHSENLNLDLQDVSMFNHGNVAGRPLDSKANSSKTKRSLREPRMGSGAKEQLLSEP